MGYDYCTKADVRLVVGAMSETQAPDDNVQQGITKAMADIKTVLPHGLVDAIDALGAGAIPPVIKSICEDLAAYYLMRGLYRDNEPLLSEWTDKYEKINQEAAGDRAKGKLQQIRDHDITIDEIASQEQVLSSTNEYLPTFDVDDPVNWKQDPDRLKDIADERAEE